MDDGTNFSPMVAPRRGADKKKNSGRVRFSGCTGNKIVIAGGGHFPYCIHASNFLSMGISR